MAKPLTRQATHVSLSDEKFEPKLASRVEQQNLIEHDPHTFLLLTCWPWHIALKIVLLYSYAHTSPDNYVPLN